MKLKPFFALLLLLILTGCANQPVENHRYFLPDTDAIQQQSSQTSPRLLQISEVQLADFLDDGGLVLQLDDITLNQAKNHLWAADLHQQINRGLRNRLNQRQQAFTVVGPQTAGDLRLSLTIDAFHGRHDGLALMSGQWQLQDMQGQIISLKNFDLQTELAASGYPALVRALGNNLDYLAAALTETLAEQP